jgi:hypothetical protein
MILFQRRHSAGGSSTLLRNEERTSRENSTPILRPVCAVPFTIRSAFVGASQVGTLGDGRLKESTHHDGQTLETRTIQEILK